MSRCFSSAIWQDVLHVGRTAQKEGCSFFALVSSSGFFWVCDVSPAANTRQWHFSSDLSCCFVINRGKCKWRRGGFIFVSQFKGSASRWRNHRGSLKHLVTLNPQSRRRGQSILVSRSLSCLLTGYCSSHA